MAKLTKYVVLRNIESETWEALGVHEARDPDAACEEFADKLVGNGELTEGGRLKAVAWSAWNAAAPTTVAVETKPVLTFAGGKRRVAE